MGKRSLQRKPTFLWQALLILLPLAVLAGACLFSLRQDKLLAQHEAAERAQVIADELLPKLWARLTATNLPIRPEGNAFQVDATGQLLQPRPVSLVPVPAPYDLATLTTEQRRLWQAAQRAELVELDNGSAAKHYRDFLRSKPPENFAAAGHYALGLAQTGQTDYGGAVEAFDVLREKYPQALSEAGLPLGPMVELKLLEMTPPPFPKSWHRGSPGRQPNSAANPIPELVSEAAKFRPVVSFDSFCSNVVYYPTPLTPYFLTVVAEEAYTRQPGPGRPNLAKPLEGLKEELEESRQTWLRIWQQQQQLRQLYSAARQHLSNNRTSSAASKDAELASAKLFWLPTPVNHWTTSSGLEIQDRDWLAMRFDESPTSHWFLCRSGAEVVQELLTLVNDSGHIPDYDYFRLGLEVAESRLILPAQGLQLWLEIGYSVGKADGVRKKNHSEPAAQLLASAVHSEAGTDLVKVSVFLSNPEALFKRQRARTFSFSALIAVSALAALLGLLAAWRAFHQQQQLSEMKSNFVSSVSHELRAPIASVRLMAESLESGKVRETEKQSEYFHFIGQECRRLSSLIENVLDFSRIEQGRKQYEFEPTDLLALTRQTVQLLQTYAAEKQVALRLDLSRLPPGIETLEITIDGRAVQQALINLVDNAFKHSPQGETVTVGLEFASPMPSIPGGSPKTAQLSLIHLWVEDRGSGIPAGEHEKIFERFYRLGSELRRETQGVGIGLSIVEHTVKAHGGRVVVRSAEGQGSRFTIVLPVQPPT